MLYQQVELSLHSPRKYPFNSTVSVFLQPYGYGLRHETKKTLLCVVLIYGTDLSSRANKCKYSTFVVLLMVTILCLQLLGLIIKHYNKMSMNCVLLMDQLSNPC
jgi:hypothetical protein